MWHILRGGGGRREELISPFAKGAVFHDVLNRVFIEAKKERITFIPTEDGGLPALFSAILEKSVDAVFMEKRPGETTLTQALLIPQKEDVKEKCAALLKQMFKTFPSCTVVETEPDWKESFFDAALRGRPDLILHNPDDDSFVIVDFKTGNAPQKKDCTGLGDDGRGIKNFQIPAYKRLAEKKAYSPVNQGFFASINKVKISSPYTVKGEGAALLEEAAEDFDRQFCRTAAEIRSINFEESYAVIYADCFSCDYKAICRSCFTIQRDKRMGRRRNVRKA